MDPDVKGYKVYWGDMQHSYSNNADVGNVTEYVITGMADSRPCYFTVTAYGSSKEESIYTNEIERAVDGSITSSPSPAPVATEKFDLGQTNHELRTCDPELAPVDDVHPLRSGHLESFLANSDSHDSSSNSSNKQGSTEVPESVNWGCFIATAAYGSSMDSHVMVLREFRDRKLMMNSAGRFLVRMYLGISPPIADFIKKHEMFRTITRWALKPIIFAVEKPQAALLIILAIPLAPFASKIIIRIRRLSNSRKDAS